MKQKNKNNEEINIYTVKFDSSAWLLDIINDSFFLFKKNKNYKIKIKILSDFKDNIVKSYLKYYFHLVFNLIVRSKIKFNIKKLNFLNLPFNKDSIYYRVLLNKKINFVFKNYEFEISKFRFSILDSIYVQAKALLFSIVIFFNYYFFKKKTDFLKLTFNNILVGPLIASTLLRETPSMGGKFNFNVKLFFLLKASVFNIMISKDYFVRNKKKNNYVIVPEPTYIQVLWKRILLKKGFKSIETHHYKGLPIINENYYNFFPWMTEKKKIKQIKDFQKKKINNFFKKRFSDPHLVISYMLKNNSNDNSNKSLLNFKKEKILLDKNEIIAVIFLHSFDDAQYIFKFDGFEDLYEWTVFTIDRCLENKEIKKILIKPHPGLDFERYPGDKVAFNHIKKRYSQNSKVEILKKDASIVNLFNNNKYAIGLTHHSSATEELTYLKKKVIGYLHGVWGKNYKFMQTWKSKEDLKNIIKRIKKGIFLQPTKKEYNIFLNYILERKININLRVNRSVRVILAKSKLKYSKWGIKGEHSGHFRYMNDIKNFQMNKKFLKDIINPIYKKNINL